MTVQLPARVTQTADAGPTDEPRGDIRLGAAAAIAFFGLFLGWASFARLDAAARADGQIVVAAHRQSVQHKEGGVVRAIDVRDGQRVKAGDVLFELVGADIQALERSLTTQVLALQAQKARLAAEQLGLARVPAPPEFAALAPADRAEAQAALAAQQDQLSARLASTNGRRDVLRQRNAELAQQQEGYRRQIAANERQQQLIGEELTGTKSLADRGYAPMTRVRALERSQAELEGLRGQYVAAVAQATEQAGETRLQILQVDRERKESIAKDQHDVEVQLGDLTPRLAAARDQLARIQVRAPASGVVVGLSMFTVGGVIAPGQHLLDIVPDRSALVIDARVSPTDADQVHAGQPADVRFTALRDQRLPILTGRVTQVSADSFQDEKTGARYFTAQVTVPDAALAALNRKGAAQMLKPGIPVQVLIPLRKRTALQYLTEPLTDTFWRGMRER